MSIARIAQFTATVAGRTIISSNSMRTAIGKVVGFMNYPNSSILIIHSDEEDGLPIERLNTNMVVLFPQYKDLKYNLHLVNTKFDKIKIVPILNETKMFYSMYPYYFEEEIKSRIGKDVYFEETGGSDVEAGKVCGYFYDTEEDVFMIIFDITSCAIDPAEYGFDAGQIEYILSEDSSDKLNYVFFIDENYKDKTSLWCMSFEEFNNYCSL